MSTITRSLVLCGALVTTPLRATLAQTAAPGKCDATGFPAPRLCAAARLDTLPASYLLMIDESGSMRPLWPAVQAALAYVADAIPEGDQLDVRLFSGSVRSLIPPVSASTASRAAWKSTFAALPAPQGGSTDLGAAAEAAIQVIRAAPVGRLQFIFFVTDGQHQPPPGSRFGTAGTVAWEDLKRDAAVLDASRVITIGVIRVAPGADNVLLPSVFPRATITDAMGAAALRQWFDGVFRSATVQQLRTVVERELRRPAWVLSSQKPISAKHASPAKRTLLVSATRTAVQTRLPSPQTIVLDGGASAVISGGPTEVEANLFGPECAWWLPPGACALNVDQGAPVATSLEPAAELQAIGINPNRADSVRLKTVIHGGGVLSWYLYYPALLILLAAAAAVAVWIKWKAHTPRLSGRLVIQEQGKDSQTVDLRNVTSRSYSLAASSGPVLSVDARSNQGRTQLYANAERPGILMNGKPLTGETRLQRNCRFEASDVTIQFFNN